VAEHAHGRPPFYVSRLAEDVDLRARVEAAERLGITLRRFEGWEPTTTYVHDSGGRLVSSTPESEWDEVEQGWMLALTEYRGSRCPGCGGDLTVTTDADNDGRFAPLQPVQCHRCVGFSQSHKAYADDPHPTSLIHQVSHKPHRG
jgi:hypothetical protein